MSFPCHIYQIYNFQESEYLGVLLFTYSYYIIIQQKRKVYEINHILSIKHHGFTFLFIENFLKAFLILIQKKQTPKIMLCEYVWALCPTLL